MSHSLGEIESLARRAARGAGMSWGLAEEAGQAIAWLCAHGLPGAEDLARLLQKQSDRDEAKAHPIPDTDIWRARSGALCPIATGATLSDRASEISNKTTLRLMRCEAPVLLLPFLASIAQRTGVVIRFTVADLAAVCSPKGLYLAPSLPVAVMSDPVDVTLTPHAPLQGIHIPTGRRAAPTDEALRALTDFANRMLAPETEERRRSGAGEDT